MATKIREVTAKHDIVLILDEVQAGFARSGKMFALNMPTSCLTWWWWVKRSGGGLPLCVLAINKNSTHGRQRSCRSPVLSVAISLRWQPRFKYWMKSAAKNLAENARIRGEFLRDELKNRPSSLVSVTCAVAAWWPVLRLSMSVNLLTVSARILLILTWRMRFKERVLQQVTVGKRRSWRYSDSLALPD